MFSRFMPLKFSIILNPPLDFGQKIFSRPNKSELTSFEKAFIRWMWTPSSIVSKTKIGKNYNWTKPAIMVPKNCKIAKLLCCKEWLSDFVKFTFIIRGLEASVRKLEKLSDIQLLSFPRLIFSWKKLKMVLLQNRH